MTWPNEKPENRALYDAYVAATGLAVAWSYQRSMDVAELVSRGITPQDIKTVVIFIKRKMARSDGGFGETSLLWRNCMQPDAMEERACLVRQWQKRREAAAPKPQVARLDAADVTRFDEAPERAPVEVTAPLARELFDLAKKLGA